MVSQVIGQAGVVRKQKQKVKVKQRRKQRMRGHHQVQNQVCPKVSESSDQISGMALPPPPPPQINVEGAEGVKRPVSIQVFIRILFLSLNKVTEKNKCLEANFIMRIL